jgi:dUTP pyrophosphatase
MSIQIRYTVTSDGTAPETAYSSPGIDLFAAEAAIIRAGETVKVRTGVCFEIPAGYVGILKDRSSSPAKGFVTLAGVIDPDYRGEVIVQLHNKSCEDLAIRWAQKIVQMLVVPAPIPVLKQVEVLESSYRGDRGFGSSDKQEAAACPAS